MNTISPISYLHRKNSTSLVNVRHEHNQLDRNVPTPTDKNTINQIKAYLHGQKRTSLVIIGHEHDHSDINIVLAPT